MIPDDVAIRIDGVSKQFQLVHDRRRSLKSRALEGESQSREEFWAVHPMDLEVARGSMIGFIGPNGSGKSTLLKMLARIYRPTTGSIAVRGRVAALLELGAGFHPDLTGRENIKLNGSILGLTKSEIADAFDKVVEFSGLGDFIDEPVKHYSSGMYVRLGFSVAVHMRPDVLLIDEVIAVGDEDFTRKCFDHIYRLRRQGVTIVLVTHALGIVSQMCDTAVWMDKGHTRAVGAAGDVVSLYLESVNKSEAARDDAERGETAAVGRSGSGEARMVAVDVLDIDGTTVAQTLTGEALRLRFTYRVDEAIADLAASISLRHESGVVVHSQVVGAGDVVLACSPGRHAFDLVLDPPLLATGRYLVDTDLSDRTHSVVYDRWPEAQVVNLRSVSAAEPAGLVHLPTRLELPEPAQYALPSTSSAGGGTDDGE